MRNNPTEHRTPLAALLLTLLLVGGCGIEIGNPVGFLFGGGEPSSSTAGLGPRMVIYDNGNFNYQLIYTNSWSLDDDDASKVIFSNESAGVRSKVTVSAMPLDEPIANLLTHVQNLEPNESWANFVNSRSEGGVQNVAEDNGNGTASSTVYFASNSVLIKITLVLNQDSDIKNQGKQIVETFDF